MAYIILHQSLGHHRKTLRLSAMLNCNRHKLLGHLDELWWWGLDNASPQGLLGEVAPEDIADAAGWPVKDALRFVEALMGCGGAGKPGFLERSAEGFCLHDWPDYTGKLNEQRALRRESNRRAQSARRQRLRTADGQRSQQSNLPDLTGPDPTGPTPPVPPPDRQRLRAADEPTCCALWGITGVQHADHCSTRAVPA